MKTLSIILSLSLFSLSSLMGHKLIEVHALPKTEAIPKAYAAESKAAIKLENLKRDADGNYVATYRFINAGKKDISYYIYPGGSPKLKIEVQKDGQWVMPGWFPLVSAAFREFVVKPGQSVVFTEDVKGAELPARVGIGCWDTDTTTHKYFTVWSDPIER